MIIRLAKIVFLVLLQSSWEATADNSEHVEASMHVNELPIGEAYHGHDGITITMTCAFSISPPINNIQYIRFLRNVNGPFVNLFEYTPMGGITDDFGRYDGGVVSGYLSSDQKSFTILIPNMRVKDSGVYQCTVLDVNGRRPRLDPVVTISIEKSPPCEPNPCYGGSCEDNRFGFTCTCDEGYTGELCDIKAPCFSNPCIWGKCIETENGTDFTCRCDPCYSGHLCDQKCNHNDGRQLKGLLSLFVITTTVLGIIAINWGLKLRRATRY